MTPQQIEIHRKRFEEIARSKVDIASDGNGHYFLSHVHYMWQGYLLCAENMQVELPEIDGTICQDAYRIECIAYLESQGYTVKTL